MEKRKLIVIGIVEDKKERRTFKFIRDLLEMSSYSTIYLNENKNILFMENKINSLLIILTNPSELADYYRLGLEFNFIFKNDKKHEIYQNPVIIDGLKKCDYFILNLDDENCLTLPTNILKGIIITYGFNNKSTLTISSCDMNPNIKANLCLQRDLKSLTDEKIEPFEFSMEIETSNREHIYPALAAAILSLVLGDSILINQPNNTIKL